MAALPKSPHGELLRALLPPMAYDATAPKIAEALTADGLTLDRAQAASARVLNGLTPFTDADWFAAYEHTYGLPDACAPDDQSLDRRIIALAVALRERRGISRRYYLWLAKVFGYSITIQEFKPFRAGSRAGDALSNGPWRYTWVVRMAETPIRTFRAGRSRAGDPLRSWGDPFFECLFRAANQPQAILHFAYGDDTPLAGR